MPQSIECQCWLPAIAMLFFQIVTRQTKYCLAFAFAQQDKLPIVNSHFVKQTVKASSVDMGDADTFMYFAYGSNLLKRRIRINNPSAEFVGIGRLYVSLNQAK